MSKKSAVILINLFLMIFKASTSSVMAALQGDLCKDAKVGIFNYDAPVSNYGKTV